MKYIEKTMTASMPFFKGNFPNHLSLKKHILDGIDFTAAESILVEGNTFISKSDWNLPNIENNTNRPYRAFFDNNIQEYYRHLVDATEYDSWKIHNIWFQQYNYNSNHNWHVHTMCQFTNVYYVELPENTPKTKIKNPFTNSVEEIYVEEGDVITFPSFIIHQAPHVKSDSRKTIISFNSDFDITGNLYDE